MTHKKLSIGFIFLDPHLGRGGLETVLMQITKGLKLHNVNSYVYMLDPTEHNEFLADMAGIYVAKEQSFLKKIMPHLPTFLSRLVYKLSIKRRVADICKEITNNKQLDVLLVLDFSDTLNLAHPILKRTLKQLKNIPLILWPHSTLRLLKPKTITKLKKSISLFDGHFAISNGIAQELQEIYQQENISLIYNPIAPAKIIARKHNKFIYLGRIGDPIKRVKELIQILQKLQGEWSLDIYGSTGSDAGDDSFRTYIHHLNMAERVTVHGWYEQPWDEINEAGVLLLNSTNEGFSLVLAEAMMRGIPCVSSDCPVGPNEIIIQGVNGWLFDVDDDQDCLKILQEIIDGTRLLPSPESVQASVMKFSLEKVIINFKENLLQSIEKK